MIVCDGNIVLHLHVKSLQKQKILQVLVSNIWMNLVFRELRKSKFWMVMVRIRVTLYSFWIPNIFNYVYEFFFNAVCEEWNLEKISGDDLRNKPLFNASLTNCLLRIISNQPFFFQLALL